MAFSLGGKVVVISGASAGIGAACAEVFAEHGATLALGARRSSRLVEMEPALKKAGAMDVSSCQLDVCDEASVERFTAEVLKRHGRIDVLINNAGLASGLDPVATGRDDDWRAMLETNVYGLMRLTRRILPTMLKQASGHIINMGSIAAFQTYANGSMYAGTKHAVKAITGALKLELNGTPLRVSEIDPGLVETEFSLVRLKDEKRAKAVYEGMTPLTGRDIAECVLFCATRPAHVNIDHVLVMPTDQATVYKVHRRS